MNVRILIMSVAMAASAGAVLSQEQGHQGTRAQEVGV